MLQQHSSASHRRICSDNCTCCHTEIEDADQTCSLTQPTSPSADSIMPDQWQDSHHSHLHLHLSRSLAGRWGTTVDSTTNFLHSSRFSALRSMVFHSRPVHSLMLSSHSFLCLPLRLCLCAAPCRVVLASPDDRVAAIRVRRFTSQG